MVPNGWLHTTFEKHIDCLTGYAFQSSNYSSNSNDTRLLRGDNIEPGALRWRDAKYWAINENITFDRYQLREGDFVIAMDRTWVSAGLKVAEVKQSDLPCLLVQRVARIRALATLDQSLLRQYFSGHRFEQHVKSVQTATAVPHISPNDIKEFPVLLPPIKEQKKIAQILSAWDKAITTAEQLLANSEQQKKALMQKLLTGKVRFSEFDGKWKDQLIGDWIVEYKEKSTAHGQHILLTSSRNGLILQSDYYGENRITERDNVGFNVIPPEYVTYRSRSDDGMFTFNINKLGITGLISVYYPVFKFGNGVTQYFVDLFKLKEKIFDSYSVGTSQKVLSLNALRSIKLKITTDIEEQKKISAVLSVADKDIDVIQQKLTCLKNEKKALMQQLLTGKRRVKIN